MKNTPEEDKNEKPAARPSERIEQLTTQLISEADLPQGGLPPGAINTLRLRAMMLYLDERWSAQPAQRRMGVSGLVRIAYAIEACEDGRISRGALLDTIQAELALVRSEALRQGYPEKAPETCLACAGAEGFAHDPGCSEKGK